MQQCFTVQFYIFFVRLESFREERFNQSSYKTSGDRSGSQGGLTALVETQETVMAAEGGEARLSCLLTQPKDVLQVTWQKLLPEGEKTVGTYNKHFGQKVSSDFRDKVKFEAAGLQNSSIVIRKVTEQDEGCYHCLFNSYPEGAHTGTTCLNLYELHEPVLHVGESNSAEEALVSCSATGRPAPTVTLSVLSHNGHFSNHSSVGVTNTNGTVAVTTTAVLSRLHDNSTQVGCAVRVLSAPQIEVLVMIPEVKQSSAADFTLVAVLSVIVSCVTVVIVVGIKINLLKQKHQNSPSHRDSEEIKTPAKIIKPTHENITPLIQQVNEQNKQLMTTGEKKSDNPKTSSPAARNKTPLMQPENKHLRQRTSTAKQQNDNPKASSSTVKCQRKLF
ncbi:OX-2 membrane glycoprotein-like isoform X2 [Micropterus dolomieu]|uniref:OX-2 membrane glycoprotein-like isoform X2 n=1 Tax=Micropterus dolomieu TaxID=147949 RepID=UPI001E8E9E29|nr:OX-2 membrane glycoprotein-like isoform X2 [Micropterus dolomieu]